MSDEKSFQNISRVDTKAQRADIRERIALTSHSVERLNSWVEQLRSKHRGVSINRKSLVNWLIETHATELSASEEEALSRAFFDELKFLEQVMDDMKRAKAEGRSTALEEFMTANIASGLAKRPARERSAKTKPVLPSAKT